MMMTTPLFVFSFSFLIRKSKFFYTLCCDLFLTSSSLLFFVIEDLLTGILYLYNY